MGFVKFLQKNVAAPMTQTFVVRSLTSMPIVVQYALSIFALLSVAFVFAQPPWLVRSKSHCTRQEGFCICGETCEHADARGASRRKRAAACLQVVSSYSQLSKNESFSTVEKRLVLHYTCAFHRDALRLKTTRTTSKNNFEGARANSPALFCLMHIVADGFWHTCAIATVQEIP